MGRGEAHDGERTCPHRPPGGFVTARPLPLVAQRGPSARQDVTVPLSDGAVAAVEVRRSARARRMTLRVPPGNGAPVVTVPERAALAAVERFVLSHGGWLAARLAERVPSVPFAPGALVPLRGVPHRIERTGRVRGTVVMDEADGQPVLKVPGAPDHLARRLTSYLRREAQADLDAAVAEFAAKVDRRPTAVRLKDTRAQWGSCSPAGVLCFSWRLVLAPPHVLRYVAAHEVAHLVELNHSAAFWRVNAALDPHHRTARAWLRRHGRALHAVGAEH